MRSNPKSSTKKKASPSLATMGQAKTERTAQRAPRNRAANKASQPDKVPRPNAATPKPNHKKGLGGEINGIIITLLGAIIFLSLISFDPIDLDGGSSTLNLIGPLGAYLANILLLLVGMGAFFFAAIFVLLGTFLILGRPFEFKPSEMVGQILVVTASAALFHIALNGEPLLDHLPGGALGAFAGEACRAFLGQLGAYLLLGSLTLLGIILVTDTAISAVFRALLVVVKQSPVLVLAPIHAAQAFAQRRAQKGQQDAAGSDADRDDELSCISQALTTAKADAPKARVALPEPSRQQPTQDAKPAPSPLPETKAPAPTAPAAKEIQPAQASPAIVERPQNQPLPQTDKVAAILAKLPLRQPDPHSAAHGDRPLRQAMPIEPAYDFDSIVPPEAIARGTILPNWKPRPLRAHTPSNPTQSKTKPAPTQGPPKAQAPALAPANLRPTQEEQKTPAILPSAKVATVVHSDPARRTAPVVDVKNLLSEEQKRLLNPTQPPAAATAMPPAPTRPAPAHSAPPKAPQNPTTPANNAREAIVAREPAPATITATKSTPQPEPSPDPAPATDPAPLLGPAIVVNQARQKPSEAELAAAERLRNHRLDEHHGGQAPFTRPPLSLLSYDETAKAGYDPAALKCMADTLEAKLADYRVKGEVVQICPGPVVTRFEFLPAPGTKVATIAGLADDLKMALEVVSIRVIAPIPGKGVVGIEVPNDSRETVYIKELLASKAFSESKSVLTLALGKDIEGSPVVSDLAKMPHLLIAGSTGSGKSVAVNTMLCSLLYNATPEEVKLILVDPKRLELSVYNGIPHLLLPPITDPKKASMALRWAVDEMERRYTLMSELGVRNIKGYNKRVGKNNNATNDPLLNARDDAGQLKHSFMPYLVIIIDELADLMMVVAKEVETSIARLAQMARACGIHLILATQRPSVDVLTGLIKANFPTRLAFRVFSRHDSKTILDTIGAEALLGMGDSLFLPPSTGLLQRVHGAFVSDEEVQSLVEFLRAQGEPDYNEDILLGNADDDNPPESADTDNDELFDQAVQIVAQSGQASASMLQRKLRVGFNRAARLIEQMEAQGIVGPADGSKPREVLVSPI